MVSLVALHVLFLLLSDNPLSSLPEPELSDSVGLHTIWTPHPKAHEYSEAVNFQPPPYLISFVKQIIRTSSLNMDLYHKEADTVDWGGEADYSGYEWFKDPPPPRQEASAYSPLCLDGDADVCCPSVNPRPPRTTMSHSLA